MNINQVSVKVFADPTSNLEPFIEEFHGWIRDDKVLDRTPIDVADYRHVPDGPGVMLITNDGHYAADLKDGPRLGFSFTRKRDAPGPVVEKVKEALAEAARGARLLEESGRARGFSTDELTITVLSRLTAPNSEAARVALEPELASALEAIYGARPKKIEDRTAARGPLRLFVKMPAPVALSNLSEASS